MRNKEEYRLQIIYTQINRDDKNIPHLTTYAIDTGKYYFYCASMVKLLGIALTMEKINNIHNTAPISIYDSIYISGDPCGDLYEAAYRNRTNFCTPAEMIKEMLLVSNNHAFNPLYDFLTQNYANKRAHLLGYASAVVANRFASCDSFQNRCTSALMFFDRATGYLKYLQHASCNLAQPHVEGMQTIVGTGFMIGDSIGPPKNFAYNNYLSLGDLHRLVTHLCLPESQPKNHHLNLSREDYAFLHKYMGMYPSESNYPVYDTVEFHDNAFKFFITPTDTSGHVPPNIRVFNKVGQAYGFTTDCSYVQDTLNKVEFILSCTMYTNKDGILNDGVYEYESIALPFFRNLFTVVYAYELARKRKHEPIFEPWDFSDNIY